MPVGTGDLLSLTKPCVKDLLVKEPQAGQRLAPCRAARAILRELLEECVDLGVAQVSEIAVASEA